MIWANYEWAWGGKYTHFYKEQSLNGCAILECELQPIKFQGQFFDVETGLHYNRFRYYDSDVGMFIQRDPIGLLGGFNIYQYVSNPTFFIDPFGLSGRGGQVHQKIQQDLQKDLSKIYGSDRVKSEGQIELGNGKSRFGDVIVYTDSTKEVIQEVHQIGDMRTRGGLKPSSRERGAIEDIRQTLGEDTRIVFHDKKQRTTLINPDLLNDWKSPKSKHRKLPPPPPKTGACK